MRGSKAMCKGGEEMKHTPGPWEVELDGSILCQETYENLMGQTRRKHVARAYLRRADARLIAAAPELLESLKEYAEGYEGTRSERDARARAAIAKAEGVD
jgi:hypothetical protein